VPIAARVLNGVLGRKLGAFVTGAGVGTIALLVTSSIVIAAIAAFVALLFAMLSGGVGGIGSPRRGGWGWSSVFFSSTFFSSVFFASVFLSSAFVGAAISARPKKPHSNLLIRFSFLKNS